MSLIADNNTRERPKIFLFGTGATGEAALSYLLNRGEVVAGVCTNRCVERPSLMFKIKVFCVQKLFDWGVRVPVDQIFLDFEAPVYDAAYLALRHNLPVFDVSEHRKDSFFEQVKRLKPDLILCFGFPKLLQQRVLDIATIAAINIHPGFLPQRGGGTPVRWAIVRGDKEIGVTAHVMTSKFDAGKVVAVQTLSVMNCDDSESLEKRILGIFPKLMDEVWLSMHNNVLEGNVESLNPPDILPPFHQGYSQIKWREHTAEYISCMVRAMKPKGGAYTYFDNQKIYFRDVSIVDVDAAFPVGENGEIIKIDRDGSFTIQTKNKGIQVHNVLFGYKIRSARFITKRLKLKAGNKFYSKEGG